MGDFSCYLNLSFRPELVVNQTNGRIRFQTNAEIKLD